MLSLRAPAKVNLYLHVTGKRSDGYHLLDSLAAFPADIYDDIIIEPSDHFSLIINGPFAALLGAEDLKTNLVTKAALAAASETGRDPHVHITLTKNIPLGSGLGGGSADAAAVVKGLEQLWNTPLPEEAREQILLQLGADVPVCYAGHACRFQGIGEKISGPVQLPPLFILVIWPGQSSFTRDVFARYEHHAIPALPERLPDLRSQDDFLAFLTAAQNSLQKPAESLCPSIGEVHDFIQSRQGCLFTRMTGSGASVFGLFESQELCRSAENEAKQAHPGWWSRSSTL